MKAALILVVGLMVSGVAAFAVAAIAVVTTVGHEVDLRKNIEAQKKTVAISFDTTWKILETKAGIVGKYKDDFKEIWPEIIGGRYKDGGGSLMKWIQERNPNFDSSLYKDLMVSVEAERKNFEREQKKLIDFHREREAYVEKPLSGTILKFFGNTEKIEIQIITSTKTEGVVESGKDDDTVDLFKKK